MKKTLNVVDNVLVILKTVFCSSEQFDLMCKESSNRNRNRNLKTSKALFKS